MLLKNCLALAMTKFLPQFYLITYNYYYMVISIIIVIVAIAYYFGSIIYYYNYYYYMHHHILDFMCTILARVNNILLYY